MNVALQCAQYAAVVLLLTVAWNVRGSHLKAWRGGLQTPLAAYEAVLFWFCLDVAYNVAFFRIVRDFPFPDKPEVLLQTMGATAHCIVALKLLVAVRAARSWKH